MGVSLRAQSAQIDSYLSTWTIQTWKEAELKTHLKNVLCIRDSCAHVTEFLFVSGRTPVRHPFDQYCA